MIIRCPECSTGFNLPDDRVTPEGTKLKCSRCAHVFRVREVDGGEGTEIFYKDGDNGKSLDKGGSSSPFGGGGSASPFAGLGPTKESAFGDVADDDGPGLSSATSEAQEMELAEASESSEPTSAPEPAPEPEPEAAPKGQEEESDPALMGSGSEFGDPEDHVDPSFGEGGPVFDPDKGKVEASSAGAQPVPVNPGGAGGQPTGPAPTPGSTAAGPPTGAKRGAPPPTAAADSSGPPSGPPTSIGSSASDDWDDDDLEAHRIGGGPGQKIVTFLFLVLLVGVGFLGTLAYLNDGFLDFYAFDEMIEVAFSDGEYEPRAEWADDGPTVQIVESGDAIAIEGVHGQLVELGGDSVFVVQGVARNQSDSRAVNVDLRTTVRTLEGRSLREVRRPMAPAIEIGEIRGAASADEARQLLDEGGMTLENGEAAAFTVILDDLPQRVIDGEHYSFGVEVADMDEAS